MATSLLMIVLVLLHKGRGGGLSDMFGGGVSTNLGGASTAERNLDRLTAGTGGAAAAVVAPRTCWAGVCPPTWAGRRPPNATSTGSPSASVSRGGCASLRSGSCSNRPIDPLLTQPPTIGPQNRRQ